MAIRDYFTTRFAPRWLILQIDIILSLFALVAAYLLRHNFELKDLPRSGFVYIFPSYVLVRVLFFWAFRVYRGITRYTGVQDAKRLFYAISLGSVVVGGVSLALTFFEYNGDPSRKFLPYSVVLIDYVITLVLLTSFRVGVKIVYNDYTQRNKKSKSNLAIFGAGRAGIITKRTIDSDGLSKFTVAAFFDDNKSLQDKYIEGIKVWEFSDTIFSKLRNELKITELIISVQGISPPRKQEIVDLCLRFGIKVKMVPPANKWINGELSLQQIKNVRIEDLLERDPIVMDTEHIKEDISNKKVLVTGAAGSIGSEMVRQLVRFYPSKIVLVDNAETPLAELKLELEEAYKYQKFQFILADVRNEFAIEQVFKALQPDIVYHVAAYKHVPMMEENVHQAISTNVRGSKMVADMALKYEASKFVMISTDKAVNPTNVMGASKRIAEIYVQSLNAHHESEGGTKFITTRFGNVLGSNGSVIPRFRKQILSRGPVTVTHPEITRYFMTIPEACQLILEAGTMGKGGEIYIFDMGEDVKIVDLARKMIKLSGFEPDKDIKIEFTGLRPGEKIREELLNVEENTIPTHHKKIMIAKVRQYDFEKVSEDVRELITLSDCGEDFEIVGKMKEIVPEFISNNSKFSKLDSPKKAVIQE